MKLISIPHLKKLTRQDDLTQYGEIYFRCSGLQVPEAYLSGSGNRVYGIYYQKQMIGGFILGKGETLRTLEVFANPDAREQLYHELGAIGDCTEITCFWIAPKVRRNTALNTFVWMCLGFSLRWYGAKNIVFGTCSASLARLYSSTPRSVLIHRDMVNDRKTFIFRGDRHMCLHAFMEILSYKWARLTQIRNYQTSQILSSTNHSS
ncbi:MAG: hypothetical protein R3D00_29680 [Bacteroidia bacterium]